MKIGDNCPKCGDPLARTPNIFFWRGDHRDGLICQKCRALWPIDGEEIEPLRVAREAANGKLAEAPS